MAIFTKILPKMSERKMKLKFSEINTYTGFTATGFDTLSFEHVVAPLPPTQPFHLFGFCYSSFCNSNAKLDTASPWNLVTTVIKHTAVYLFECYSNLHDLSCFEIGWLIN